MKTDIVSTYPAHIETMRQRFDQALGQTGFDRIIIHSGSQREHFLDDSEAPFKVNPHFNTWLPVTDNPDCFIIYEPGSTPVLLYHRPEDFWHKPPEAPTAFWTPHFDIRFIERAEDVRDHVPDDDRRGAFIGEWQARFADWSLGAPNPDDLLHYLHYERAFKTDYELACLRAASRAGTRGHLATRAAFHNGASEFQMLLAFLEATGHTQQELPYDAIIALNEHASTLHYQLFDRKPPAERHSFLIDSGASVNGYASDITRTYSAEDDEFAQLIAALDEAQQSLVDAVRADADYPALHLQAHRRVAQLLVDFDFVRMEAESIVESGVSNTFLPHGLGHFLGLQVHDAGGFQSDRQGNTIAQPEGHPFLRLTRRLKPRYVLTIEPGLYFIESLLRELKDGPHGKEINWTKVDTFRRYGGIRIEDDIVVTEGAPENLTREAFAAV